MCMCIQSYMYDVYERARCRKSKQIQEMLLSFAVRKSREMRQ